MLREGGVDDKVLTPERRCEQITKADRTTLNTRSVRKKVRLYSQGREVDIYIPRSQVGIGEEQEGEADFDTARATQRSMRGGN